MLYSLIKKAVTKRFSDEAISVREAAASLVGTYVVHSPAVANAFHIAFLTGLNDSGVSVRKRTVKILQDILCSNPAYEGRAAACSEMLKLAADPKEDDGVRDLIHGLFMKVWLEDGDKQIEQEFAASPVSSVNESTHSPIGPGSLVEGLEEVPVNGVGAGIVTPTPKPRHPLESSSSAKSTRSTVRKEKIKKTRLQAEIASEQMCEVVKAANTGENLAILLRELLSGVSDSDKGRKSSERRKRQSIAQNHCSMLVDALFEILLKVEERRPQLGAQVGRELVATIRTIQVFTDVSPSVVLRHFDTLLPYLKADNGVSMEDESAAVSSVCVIISKLTQVFDVQEIERISGTSLGDDLVKITYRFGRESLSSAVRALCTLAHHPGSGEESPFRKKLLKLAHTFYQYLVKNQDESDFSSMNVRSAA
jgi:cohesin loading factor subunit SCC2